MKKISKPVRYPVDVDGIVYGFIEVIRMMAEGVILNVLDNNGKIVGSDEFPYNFYKDQKLKNKLRLIVQRLLNINTDEATKGIYGVCLKISNNGLPDYTHESKYTQKEYDEALEILKNKKPIKYIKKVISSEHVGDDALIPLPAFSIATLGLDADTRINLQTYGDTGKGKSDLYQTFMKAVPRKYYEILTNLSPRAMEYVSEKFVTDKILYFDEVDAIKEDEIITLRCMTWGKKKFIKQPIALTVKEQEMLLLKFKGKNLSVWMSGTRPINDNQLLSRFIVLSINTSKEQDWNVHLHHKYSIGKTSYDGLPHGFKIIRAMIKILLKHMGERVLIPYADFIDFKLWEDRRSYPIFMTLIMASAKWHRFQRHMITINGVNHIIATAEDFEYARGIFNRISPNQVTKLGERELKILDVLPDGNCGDLTGMTRSEISEKTNISRTAIRYSIENRLLNTTLVNSSKRPTGWKEIEYWRTDNYKVAISKMFSPVLINWGKFTKEAFIKFMSSCGISTMEGLDAIYFKITDIDEILTKAYPLPDAWSDWIVDFPDRENEIRKKWLFNVSARRNKGKYIPTFIYDTTKKMPIALNILPVPPHDDDIWDTLVGDELHPDETVIRHLEEKYKQQADKYYDPWED